MDHIQFPHYHIRWSDRTTLDWECFSTSAAAEKRAKDLVRPDQTYTVEEHSRSCHRCRDARNLRFLLGSSAQARA